MLDLFDIKNIEPMLLSKSSPFNDNNYLHELKLDGIRSIAYLDLNSVEIRNKRNKDVTSIYPELKNIYKAVNRRCILDGELILLKDGKPDFFQIQKRSLMTDAVKIKIASKNPVSFVAFDILYLDNEDLTNLPLIERKKILENIVTEKYNLNISRYILEKGIEFFEIASKNNLEGIVSKKLDSKYKIGKRSKEWFKVKVLEEEDLIICGYYEKDEFIKVILGYFESNTLCSRGIITLRSKSDIEKIREFSKNNTITKPHFDNYDATWFKLELVCTVSYMHLTENKSMRQPVWKGFRHDKKPKDCIKD